jgi:hypothetical protein
VPNHYFCARYGQRRLAIIAASGGLALLIAAALVLTSPRQMALARHNERVAVVNPPVLPTDIAGLVTPGERARTPVTTEKPAEARPPENVSIWMIVVKRRVERTEEELEDQIRQAPVVALDRTADRVESRAMIAAAREADQTISMHNNAPLELIELRPDLAGLPLRRGKACRLPEPAAAHFDECSRILRGQVSNSHQLRKTLAGDSRENKWLKSESVPVLMQMLMAEAVTVREVLTEQLLRIRSNTATAALAQLALFDLSPQVRARAVVALADRPTRDFERVLLGGFEYPWPAVADHAAEAIVALKMKETLPDLARLLTEPDPTAPYVKPGSDRRSVKEMVRVNHLQNCLLCHPPSFRTQDRVRGVDPTSDPPREQVVPPKGQVVRKYYEASPEQQKGPSRTLFVRADVTYLKQDFSRMLPVANPGKLPSVQRFDYFVRERPATEREIAESVPVGRNAPSIVGPSERQNAVMFALRELTGHNPGPTVRDWKNFIAAQRLGQ